MRNRLLAIGVASMLAGGAIVSSASAGVVTEITLGDFSNASVLDFNTAPLGNISGTDTVFTDFGITQASGTGSGFNDTFNTRSKSSRALWFNAGGLAVVDPGDDDNAIVNQSFMFDFAEQHNRFGFGAHDQADLDLTITFFDNLVEVGSIVITTVTNNLSYHFLENTDSFNLVVIVANDDGGFAIDDLTLDEASAADVPVSGTLAFIGLGLAGLGLARRRRMI